MPYITDLKLALQLIALRDKIVLSKSCLSCANGSK